MIVSLKWLHVPFQYDQLLKTEVPLAFKSQTTSISEVHRPVAIAPLFLVQNPKSLVSLSHQLRTKEVILNLSILLATPPSQQLHSPKRILLPYNLLHKPNQNRMEFLLILMIQLPIAYFFIMRKSSVKGLPVIHLHTLISIGLEYLNNSVGKFNHHTYVIVLTICYQPLHCTFWVVCFHEENITWLGYFEKLFLEESVLVMVEFLAAFPYF